MRRQQEACWQRPFPSWPWELPLRFTQAITRAPIRLILHAQYSNALTDPGIIRCSKLLAGSPAAPYALQGVGKGMRWFPVAHVSELGTPRNHTSIGSTPAASTAAFASTDSMAHTDRVARREKRASTAA